MHLFCISCIYFVFYGVSIVHCRYRKIAGDKCIDGNETFYLDVSVQCPVLGPGDMSITVQQLIIPFNKSISFTLHQYSVSQ